MGIPAPTELLLILGIVLLVFGGKKIPEIMNGLGQGIRIFKKSLEHDEVQTTQEHRQPTQPQEEAKPIASTSGKIEPK